MFMEAGAAHQRRLLVACLLPRARGRVHSRPRRAHCRRFASRATSAGQARAELHQAELERRLGEHLRRQAARPCHCSGSTVRLRESPRLHRVRCFGSGHSAPSTCCASSSPTARRKRSICTPVLAGELVARRDRRCVQSGSRLDPEVHTLVWPNGADFDPTTLHDWPLVVDELTFRARGWASTPDAQLSSGSSVSRR